MDLKLVTLVLVACSSKQPPIEAKVRAWERTQVRDCHPRGDVLLEVPPNAVVRVGGHEVVADANGSARIRPDWITDDTKLSATIVVGDRSEPVELALEPPAGPVLVDERLGHGLAKYQAERATVGVKLAGTTVTLTYNTCDAASATTKDGTVRVDGSKIIQTVDVRDRLLAAKPPLMYATQIAITTKRGTTHDVRVDYDLDIGEARKPLLEALARGEPVAWAADPSKRPIVWLLFGHRLDGGALGDVNYTVATVEGKRVFDELCSYDTGVRIQRTHSDDTAIVREARTGKQVAAKQFRAKPASCPPSLYAHSNIKLADINTTPEQDEIVAWAKSVVR